MPMCARLKLLLKTIAFERRLAITLVYQLGITKYTENTRRARCYDGDGWFNGEPCGPRCDGDLTKRLKREAAGNSGNPLGKRQRIHLQGIRLDAQGKLAGVSLNSTAKSGRAWADQAD